MRKGKSDGICGMTKQERGNITYIKENCISDPICYGKTQVQLLSLKQKIYEVG